MNIGFVTVWGHRGASVVSQTIINTLKTSENEIYVYSRGGEESIKFDSLDSSVHAAKRTYLPITTHIDKNDFLRWVSKNDIELVVFNEQHWFQPLIWLKELGIKCVSYIDYYTEETVPLFKLYDGLICNTKRHYEVFKDQNSIYVPWGVDLELFKATAKVREENKIRFFHSCGMNPNRKGTDILLEAATMVERDFKLIIHSQVALEDFFSEDEVTLSNIRTLRRSDRLEVINKSVEPPGLYSLGDIYVYPCRLDGLGLTVPEAIASGLPTIVPDFEPMTDFISSECKRIEVDRVYSRRDGYYWPQHLVSSTSLADKMMEFLESQKSIEDIQKIVRDHAKKNLDWVKNSADLNRYIYSVEFHEISEEDMRYYIDFSRHGHRKIEFLIEKFKFIFSPLFYTQKKILGKL